MIKTSLKLTAVAAMLAGASVGAQAQEATRDLGPVHFGTPTSFSGSIDAGASSFNDIFTFTPDTPNIGSGASVVNIPLTIPGDGNWNAVLSTMTLMSAGADNIVGTMDDSLLATATAGANEVLSLTYDAPITGVNYLNVTGIGNGSEGGLYSGYVGIAPIPEPET